jgi:hypothetical protein
MGKKGRKELNKQQTLTNRKAKRQDKFMRQKINKQKKRREYGVRSLLIDISCCLNNHTI